AEDGIRDLIVTGVQTCALPICTASLFSVKSDDRRAFRQQGYVVLRRVFDPGPLLAELEAAFSDGFRPMHGVQTFRAGQGKVTLRSEERRVGKEGRGWVERGRDK